MPPFAPSEVSPVRVIRWRGNRPQPEIPVEMRRHGWEFLEALLATIAGADPHVHFADLADGVAADEFHHASIIGSRVNLRADLGHSLRLPRGLGDNARLGNRARQWLLAIKMPSAIEPPDAGDGVRVVRRRDDDSVEILLIHEPAEIAVGFSRGKTLCHRPEPLLIHVTQRNDVGDSFELSDAEAALAGHTDDADVQLVIG